MKSFTCACVLLLLASSALAAPHRQNRRLAQAFASATATSNGGSANSVSNAFSDGSAPAVSVVNSNAGPGQVVNCYQTSVSGQVQFKDCPPGTPGYVPAATVPAASSSSATAGASASAGGSTWFTAPACTKAAGAYRVVRDQQGRPWGYDNVSCALRDANGNPTA